MNGNSSSPTASSSNTCFQYVICATSRRPKAWKNRPELYQPTVDYGHKAGPAGTCAVPAGPASRVSEPCPMW